MKVLFLYIILINGLISIKPVSLDEKWLKPCNVKEGLTYDPNTLINNHIYSDLNVKDLDYEIEIMDIYMGNFSDVPWQRDDILFGLLLNSYINSFAKSCDAYLPENKEMLYGEECAEKQITRNGYGIIINETCIRYRKVPLYLYLAPEMARAKEELDAFQLKWMGEMMRGTDGLGTSAKLMSETKAITLDMSRLLKMNSCNSPGLKRFQENLRRYAHSMEPIRLENLIARRKTKLESLSLNQNVEKLLEDLVYQNSRQWNFNQYHKGSIKNVEIQSTDGRGRPQKLKASYTYSGFGGTKYGSVTLSFDSKGLPDCMYFSDFPTTCRPANRKIVMSYAKNDYARSLLNSKVQNKMVETPVREKIVETEISPGQEIKDVPFAVIQEAPAYPSCEGLQNSNQIKQCTSQKISQFVNKNFNTGLAKNLGLSGINRVIVQFRINPHGIIENIRARAPHPLLEQEAERVINLLPAMTPGKQKGRIVGVLYSLPIAFKVPNDASIQNQNLNSEEFNKSANLKKISSDKNKLRKLLKLDTIKENN